MTRFRFLLEYDGSGFAGWQRQPGGVRTVQGCLETALADLSAEPVSVSGAGRTDAGVHALGQVAAATLATQLGPEALRPALNARLPDDLVALRVDRVPEVFHPRRDARGKLYRYAIWNGPVRSPLREARSHHVSRPLDLAAMGEAAAWLEGTHDFASFQASGSSVRTSVRRLTRLAVLGESGAELALEVEGDGFLRHMVRNLAGTLIDVGLGRRPAASLPAILAARRRSAAGATAPAHGLTLVRVDYGPDSGAITAG